MELIINNTRDTCIFELHVLSVPCAHATYSCHKQSLGMKPKSASYRCQFTSRFPAKSNSRLLTSGMFHRRGLFIHLRLIDNCLHSRYAWNTWSCPLRHLLQFTLCLKVRKKKKPEMTAVINFFTCKNRLTRTLSCLHSTPTYTYVTHHYQTIKLYVAFNCSLLQICLAEFYIFKTKNRRYISIIEPIWISIISNKIKICWKFCGLNFDIKI